MNGISSFGFLDEHVWCSCNCSPAKLDFLANTWEVTFADNCTLHVDVLGQRWHLVNWHLHNAEHAVNG